MSGEKKFDSSFLKQAIRDKQVRDRAAEDVQQRKKSEETLSELAEKFRPIREKILSIDVDEIVKSMAEYGVEEILIELLRGRSGTLSWRSRNNSVKGSHYLYTCIAEVGNLPCPQGFDIYNHWCYDEHGDLVYESCLDALAWAAEYKNLEKGCSERGFYLGIYPCPIPIYENDAVYGIFALNVSMHEKIRERFRSLTMDLCKDYVLPDDGNYINPKLERILKVPIVDAESVRFGARRDAKKCVYPPRPRKLWNPPPLYEPFKF